MNVPDTVRCRGCGVVNAVGQRECASCGTFLPATPAASAVPSAEPSAGPLSAPTQEWARIGGVVRVFLAALGLGAAGIVADKLGAPALIVDVTVGALIALIAVACAISARAEIAPLLARTGGWRGWIAAVAGLAGLIAFGLVYFPTLRRLGIPMIAISSTYVQAGWPLWAIYGVNAAAPGVFEELIFRGYVMARLDTLLTPTEALLVQAALFALLHLGIAIFPSHFVIGLILGAVRRRARSLYPGMAVHAGWNALVLAAELAGWDLP